MKFTEKILALKLRKSGLSYSKILEKIKVSKSTLSIWLREIELTSEQKSRLLNKMDQVRYKVAKRKVADRKKRTKEIIINAKKEISSLKEDPLFFVGLALYWAEGAKNPVETVKFANSDEKMILLIMRWFRKICRVPERKFKIHIHMHTLHFRKNTIKYWSEVTGIPTTQFYRPYTKSTSLGQRRNILYNGTCSIIIHDKSLFRRILGWKLGMQNYFNILS
ncbi:MAG: helix-turn-helix domain-containing protein [bacterium]|nr:helix-turn-helix domain-containing protein [bacterium]